MCLRFCKCIGIAIISTLIGIAIGIAFFNGLLTGITAAIIIALIFAALSLLLLTIIGTSGIRKVRECVCKIGNCALLGAITTIILGTIALALTLVTASVGFAILIGLGGAAFFFTLFSIAELISCIFECKYDYECND